MDLQALSRPRCALGSLMTSFRVPFAAFMLFLTLIALLLFALREDTPRASVWLNHWFQDGDE